MEADQPPVQLPGAAGNTEIAPAHGAVSQKLGYHPFGDIGWNGKADALGHNDDGGINPDYAAVGVYQRTTGIAGIEGAVC